MIATTLLFLSLIGTCSSLYHGLIPHIKRISTSLKGVTSITDSAKLSVTKNLLMWNMIFLSQMAVASASPNQAAPISGNGGLLLNHFVDQTKHPFIDGAKLFRDGKISVYEGETVSILSPISNDEGIRITIGRLAQMKQSEVEEVLESSQRAWNGGQGIWPQMKASARIETMEKVVTSLKEKRNAIIEILMWEICKSQKDASIEFDRTMEYIEATIAEYRSMEETASWTTVGRLLARVRRAAIGIMLCMGPFNYPFNETYATLIPALLLGNVAVLKLPSVGGLAHILTMEAFAQHLPPGVINFVSGAGRTTVGPMMRTGAIDILAFIGGSGAADAIIKEHPAPHRLTIYLGLEAKNVGIVCKDADLTNAVDEVTLGATSYNGQRCTAIKLVMVHKSIIKPFLAQFSAKVSGLKAGLPWDDDVKITPLAEGQKKIDYLQGLITDAVEKGAVVVNAPQGGGTVGPPGGPRSLLMRPAVLYPVTRGMRVWDEEQFGPVVPVATYSSTQELLDYFRDVPYGQQVALFTTDEAAAAPLVDALGTTVGRINLNTQCGRSPDTLPFSGRRSSALGSLSVSEALRAFSVETVVAAKDNDANNKFIERLDVKSNFLSRL